MDDTEDDARYPPNNSLSRQKIPFLGGSYPRPANTQYEEEDDEEDDNELEQEEDEEEQEEEAEEEEGEEEEEEEIVAINNNNVATNGFPSIHKNVSDLDDDSDEDDDEDDDDDENNDEERREYSGGVDSDRHRKKRKLKSLIASYEFAPRVAPPPPTTLPPPAAAPARPSPAVGRNSLTDWTERETFVLLDSWGDRFLRRGKKSLRTEEWQEVAERVSEVSKVVRTETQCRNRLDTLKKKYKKEKLTPVSKWVYFKKMDRLLSMSSPQTQQQQEREKPKSSAARTGLSCGMDSGEYVFTNPRAYLNRANGLDEMRDSPGNSESAGSDGYGSDGLPPKKRKYGRENDGPEEGSSSSSLRLIAKSIYRFSEIYEKIEASKREQMVEIEKMRMDFQRDLEVQKRQIMERGHAEIARIRRGDDDEDLDDVDVSAENGSG